MIGRILRVDVLEVGILYLGSRFKGFNERLLEPKKKKVTFFWVYNDHFLLDKEKNRHP